MRHRFLGLRHHAVVRAHHQHDDVGHFCAARAHARKRLVARRIDEDDAAIAHVHLVRADMLRDSPRFSGGDFGFADGVEQAGLAVVHVAHHGHHGSARQRISSPPFLDLFFLDELLFVRDHLYDSIERLGKACRRLYVERLVDAGENAAIEKRLQQFLGSNIEFFGELANRDSFGDRHRARFALDRSDRLNVRGAPRSHSGARAHRMKPSLTFRISLFDRWPPARGRRLARIQRFSRLSFGNATGCAGPLAADWFC